MFDATIAGSLPRPDWLAEPEKLKGGWKLQGAELREGQNRAAREWIKHQEDAGINTVTDGEVYRTHFVHTFLEGIEGIDQNVKTLMGIRDNRYNLEVPTVTGKLSRPKPIHLEDVKYIRSITEHPIKFTLPGPMTICDTIADDHYGNRADMAMAFAEILNEEAKELVAAGVDIIQFDEPAFNAFTDDVVAWGCDTLDRAIEGLGVKTAVHVCYGYGIQENIDWKNTLGDEWLQYDAIFPAMNKSNIDQVSLECASSHVPISLIKHLKDKELMIGCVAVTPDKVETQEEIVATIKEAMKYADKERILPCSNCGMTPISYDIALAKVNALGAGAELARKTL